MTISRPEHDLLRCVARRQVEPCNVTKIHSLLKGQLDWDYLVSLARDHGVLPLLSKHLNETARELIPPKVISTLKRESVTNTQSVLHLVAKTLKANRAFSEHGIDSAIFKGAVLAEMAYGEVGLRQAGDIDILISRPQFAQTRQVLESLGYEMYPQLNAAQLSSHLSFHCELQFLRDDWFTVVDLHWGLTPQSFAFGIQGDEVLTRLQTVSFAGGEVKTFANDDLVLYLAIHGAKHLWRRLEWISSLAEVVRMVEPAAWTVIVERALKARAAKILALGLQLVENQFEVTVSREVLQRLDANGAMKALALEIGNDLFNEHDRTLASSESHLYNLKVMDRKRDALGSALRAFFVPTLSDWEALKLPPSLHSLYYAYRPLRLSRSYSSALLRKLTHKPAR
jgi:hypothetical protein